MTRDDIKEKVARCEELTEISGNLYAASCWEEPVTIFTSAHTFDEQRKGNNNFRSEFICFSPFALVFAEKEAFAIESFFSLLLRVTEIGEKIDEERR